MGSKIALTLGAALYSTTALSAGNTLFDDAGPNTTPAVALPVPQELIKPFVLPSAPELTVSQKVLADRNTQLGLGEQNSGAWDMIDTNRTGPDANRYLFMPFEPSTGSGVQRIDLWDPNYNTRTKTVVNPLTDNFIRGDASRWAPWGGWLTGEEDTGTGFGTLHGRMFEVTNPVTANGRATPALCIAARRQGERRQQC